MRCQTCGGSLYRDLEDVRCLACGRSPVPPRVATALEKRLTGAQRQLTPEVVRAIKADLTADGPRMDLYRRLAVRYLTSVHTVRKLATGETWKEVTL